MLILDLGNLKVNSEKNKVGGDDKVINILKRKSVRLEWTISNVNQMI